VTRIGVLSNPRSQRNRKGMNGLRTVLEQAPEVVHEDVLDFTELGAILKRFREEEVSLLAVNGGDGTVQAVLTELMNDRQADAHPALAILPGGMTNVIARDVGLNGSPAKALARLIRKVRAGQPLEQLRRPLLGLTMSPGSRPVYGMFFGAAAFYQAIMLAHEKVHPTGVAGSLASAASLSLILLRLLTSRPGPDNPLYHGEAIALKLDGEQRPEQPYLLLLATTLHRLILGMMPFWGGGGGAIRCTSLKFPPQHLGRALLPVLRGRPKPWMAAEGYKSETATDLSIATRCPVVLDGEVFHPLPGLPIRLRGDREAVFARC
jgi:hypothetical protein